MRSFSNIIIALRTSTIEVVKRKLPEKITRPTKSIMQSFNSTIPIKFDKYTISCRLYASKFSIRCAKRSWNRWLNYREVYRTFLSQYLFFILNKILLNEYFINTTGNCRSAILFFIKIKLYCHLWKSNFLTFFPIVWKTTSEFFGHTFRIL